ncbi:MAG: hypothetical protein HC779_03525 [Phyllobacteriaceae bacterium]|nr:hypothetical protein [Phyllobacteriaceae bacterium]
MERPRDEVVVGDRSVGPGAQELEEGHADLVDVASARCRRQARFSAPAR